MVQVDEQLRNATIEVLREQGWDGLTLERVAEVAGRARSTLWRQGLDLDALIGALVGDLAADFRSTIGVLVLNSSPARLVSWYLSQMA